MKPVYRHTNIIARDWQDLVRFYEDVFDCVYLPPKRDLSGKWLSSATGVPDARIEGKLLRLPGFRGDGPTLKIFSYSQMEENLPPAANRIGLGHLAFSVDDVQGILEKVITCGGKASALATPFVKSTLNTLPEYPYRSIFINPFFSH